MEKPEAVDVTYIAEFLMQRDPSLTKQKATATASDIMIKLMDFHELTFICKRCSKIKGVCRCLQHGRQSFRGWEYRLWAKPWRCSVGSLIKLSDASLQQLGPKSRPRVRALISHLKHQK